MRLTHRFHHDKAGFEASLEKNLAHAWATVAHIGKRMTVGASNRLEDHFPVPLRPALRLHAIRSVDVNIPGGKDIPG